MNKKKYSYILYCKNKVLTIMIAYTLIDMNEPINYNGVLYKIESSLPSACIGTNEYVIPCSVKCLGNVRYKWVANCTDGSWDNESEKTFSNKKECYEDMRNNALEKMKWNTEFKEDFGENMSIDYKVSFLPNEIRHESYSGLYIYKIVEMIS